jgi:AbrB family looped-hinge helix DNA binding protein
MLAVTVSPKFQVVIPQSVRELMHLEVGQKMQVLAYDGRIELLLIEAPRALRGFLSGIDTTVEREGDRV